jgi:hypothetical protein
LRRRSSRAEIPGRRAFGQARLAGSNVVALKARAPRIAARPIPDAEAVASIAARVPAKRGTGLRLLRQKLGVPMERASLSESTLADTSTLTNEPRSRSSVARADGSTCGRRVPRAVSGAPNDHDQHRLGDLSSKFQAARR